MKTSSLIVALTVATAFAAAPAIAKTSVSKSLKACKTAAEKQEPAPKFVIVDSNSTTANKDALTVRLKVKNADDSMSAFTCKVDRDTGEPTLAPVS